MREMAPGRPNKDALDLVYRRTVHQVTQSRESIPRRVQVKLLLFLETLIDLESQEYGTQYWTTVSDLGILMESLANYLRYV